MHVFMGFTGLTDRGAGRGDRTQDSKTGESRASYLTLVEGCIEPSCVTQNRADVNHCPRLALGGKSRSIASDTPKEAISSSAYKQRAHQHTHKSGSGSLC